jgi:hypothetical protein
MKVRIARRVAFSEPWSVPMAAVLGFTTGIFLAMIRHFNHDHPGYTPDALVTHFVPHLVATVTVCTLLFVLVAAVVNGLAQKR